MKKTEEKKYRKVKARMVELGVDQAWLAKKFGVYRQTMGAWLNGKTPIDLCNAYKIMEYLKLPEEQIYTYFPPGGVSKQEAVAYAMLNAEH